MLYTLRRRDFHSSIFRLNTSLLFKNYFSILVLLYLQLNFFLKVIKKDMEQHNPRRMREKRSKAFVSFEWFYIYNNKICINVLYKYICIYIHIYTLRYMYIPWDICFINKVCPCGGTTISSGLKSVIPNIRGQNIFELSIFLYLNVKMKPFYTKKPLKGVPKNT